MNLKRLNSSFFLVGLLFLSFGNGFAQSPNFNKIKQFIEDGQNFSALKLIQTSEKGKISKAEWSQLLYFTAKAYDSENQDDNAMRFFIKAKQQFLAIDSLEAALKINLDIAYLLSCQKGKQKEAENYIREYLDFANKNGSKLLLAKGYSEWASTIMEQKPEQSLFYYKKALQINASINDDAVNASIYNNIAVLYNEKLDKPDSALFYLKKDLQNAIRKNKKTDICINYINQAASYYYKNDYIKAIALLKAANKIPLQQHVKGTKLFIPYILSLNYEALGDYKNAYSSLNEFHALQDEQLAKKQDVKIAELQIQYKTKEKELENRSLKSENQNNRTRLILILGLLIVIVAISVLAYKNISKKKKIADQEKRIQTQKLEKTLQDQELLGIDLMLESQEKERQHIANELHDNLGSMLATLKLNFQNLKRQKTDLNNQENKLYNKTDALIEEAYQKVRNISHLKNLGVIGNQGLLIAVKKMAEKMSVANKFQVNVFPFGLDERLENTIEIFLYRMIQELCTNSIKHAEAREVTIYLTQHNHHEINIIIEDDGKGFDPKTIVIGEGIGLKSIEKKIEQMGGTFTIDSIIGKGTTIIIDMPI